MAHLFRGGCAAQVRANGSYAAVGGCRAGGVREVTRLLLFLAESDRSCRIFIADGLPAWLLTPFRRHSGFIPFFVAGDGSLLLSTAAAAGLLVAVRSSPLPPLPRGIWQGWEKPWDHHAGGGHEDHH